MTYKRFLPIFVAMALVWLTACSSRKETVTTEQPNSYTVSNSVVRVSNSRKQSIKNTTASANKTTNPGVIVNDTTPMGDSDKMTSRTRAKRIADRVTEIEGVKTAQTVITGNTAIVGLTLDKELTDEPLIELKRLVEKNVRKLDNSIDHVSITTAPDLVRRITDLAAGGISDNRKNLENYRDDDILFRVAPTL